MIKGPPCPRCHSANTTMFTTVHRNDSLCFCLLCQHFWRPLEETYRVGEHKDPEAPTDPAPSPGTDSDDEDS